MDHFNFFLSHGLWSVVESLFNASERIIKEDDKISMEKLMLELATHPTQSRISSPTIRKPWQLSWLASSCIYKLLSPNSQELRSIKWFSGHKLCRTDVEKLRKVSEMHGLLCNLPEEISFELKNEIIQLYIGILSVDHSKTQASIPSPSNPRGISLNAVEYLQKCLLQNPLKTNPIIQRLLCLWSSQFSHSDDMLQGIYESAFKDILNGPNFDNEENLSKMLSLLTIYEVSEEKEKKFVESVFPKLLDSCYSNKSNLAQVYLSLVGRGKFGLLRVLLGLETGKDHWNSPGSQEDAASGAILEKLVDKGQINMREIFLRAYKRNVPWVEDLVELCLHAITNGHKEKVIVCLSHSGLKDLWPLVCYRLWEHFLKHGETAEEYMYIVIEECKKCAKSEEYSLQMSQMERCLRFAEWIMKSGAAKKDSITSILEKVINSCCAVHALKQTSRLEDLDESAVIAEVALLRSDVSSDPSYKWMAETELSIIRGYFIVMTVYKAILSSVEAEHLDTSGPANREAAKKMYEEKVSSKLKEVKISLSQLQPLSFRVDILEYMFSLLFLQHKDVNEENTSDSGGEDSDVLLEEGTLKDSSQQPSNMSINKVVDSPSMPKLQPKTKKVSPSTPSPPLLEVQVPQLRRVSQQRSHKGKESVCSEASASSYLMPGLYICGPRVVRDLLQCLKDCLVDASVALFGLLASVDTGADDGGRGKGGPTSTSPTESVAATHEALQKRLARLSHSVGEAACRLEIVTSSEGLRGRGSRQGMWPTRPSAVGAAPMRVCHLWSEDDSEDEWGGKQAGRSSSVGPRLGAGSGEVRSKKFHSENDKSSESGSNAAGGTFSEGGRRRRRVGWRKRSSSSSGNGAMGQTSRPSSRSIHQGKTLGIIERMLASPRSLVVQCLAQGEIVKAQKVIKLFKLEESGLALEARFLEEYDSLLHKLEKKTKEGKLNMDSSSPTKWKSPLQSVKYAASVGMHSTSFSSLVEAFLTTVKPPVVEGLEAIAFEGPDIVSSFLGDLLPSDEHQSLLGYSYIATILIDLALTYAGTVEQSYSLVDVALKRCPQRTKAGRVGSETEDESSAMARGAFPRSPKYYSKGSSAVASVQLSPMGPVSPPDFLRSLHSALKVVNERCFCGTPGLWSLTEQPIFGPQCEKLSVPSLVSSCLPLSPEVLASYLSFWEDLHEAVCAFKGTFVKGGDVGSDEDSVGTGSQSSEMETAKKRVTLKELHASKANSAFSKIIAVSRSIPWCFEGLIHRERMKRPSGSRDPQYLQMLFTYLKMLSSLIVQSSLQTKGYSIPTNYLDVLTEDVGSIFGKLVFECDIPPSRLESTASKMNLDLVCCIMGNCCPPIKSEMPPLIGTELYKTGKVELRKWGRIVLNPLPKGWHGPARPPGPLLESLLSSLLEELHAACDTQGLGGSLGLEDLATAVQSTAVRTLLEEGTWELATVDLSLLTPGDDMLIFLTNLANLLTLHAILFLEVGVPENDHPLGLLSNSRFECLLARMSVCYNISSMGVISIHELVQATIGSQLALAVCDPSTWSDGHSENSKAMVPLRTWPFPLHPSLCPLPSLPTPQPALLFALCTGRAWCPRVPTLLSSSSTNAPPLSEQLNELMCDYLSAHVTTGPGGLSNTLTVPRMVCLYRSAVEDDSSSFWSEDSGGASCHSDTPNLIKFLSENLSGPIRAELLALHSRVEGGATTSDLMLKVSAPNYSPRITLSYAKAITERERFEEAFPSRQSLAPEWSWKGGPLPTNVLEYLELRCWPLAIVAAIANAPGSTVVLPPLMPHATCFKHLLHSILGYPEIVDHHEKMLAALSPEGLPSSRLWHILDSLFLLDDLPGEWLLALLTMVPQPRLYAEPKMVALHDLIMWDVASRKPSEGIEEPWRYGIQIRDPATRVACVLHNITTWASCKEGACREALLSLCGNKAIDVPPATKALVLDTLRMVEVYEKVFAHVKSTEVKNWHDVSQPLETDPGLILHKLSQAKQLPLFLKWMELRKPSEEVLSLIGPNVLVTLLDADAPDFASAQKLLGLLSLEQASQVCQGSLPLLHSAPCLRFALSFLLDSCRSTLVDEQVSVYEQWALGLIMVSHRLLLGSGGRKRPPHQQRGGEYQQTWSWLDLAPFPLLIVEQLLMNVQLEALEGVLALAKPHLKPHDALRRQGINVGDVDSLLRQYATKALDFRVYSISQVQRDEASSRSQPVVPPPSVKMSMSASTLSLATVTATVRGGSDDPHLIESMSSGSVHSLDLASRIPPKVPTKAEWVPNDQVTVCMCCQMVTFSMFNRRHHCRRCGRVVCGLCSTRRLKVAGYGDVPVRVCDGCHRHISESSRGEAEQEEEQEEEGEEVDEEAEDGDGAWRSWWWRLSGDPGQDATVREEFAFEQAPSASLCLAILAHHSPGGPHHPRLLIESAERLLSHLRPSPNHTMLNPEVDHALLIQMVRSLAVASKVLYSRIGMSTGIERCDRVIGRAGLLNLLVRSGWAGAGEWAGALLAPHDGLGPPTTMVDDSSSVGGGGSSLSAGRSGSVGRRPATRGLPSLRDRLVKEEQWELALEVATKGGLGRAAIWAAWGKACLRVGGWKRARSLFARCLQKPSFGTGATSTSPTAHLNEILQILEESSVSLPIPLEDAPNRVTQPYPSVLESLSSLDSIAKGIILLPSLGTRERPVWSGPPLSEDVRDECLYYLRTYGTDTMMLDFHLRHGELKEALLHFLNVRMNPEAFLDDVYLRCFRKGWVQYLEAEMKAMDPSLDRWKPHLCCMCRSLERRGMLQVLYKLQVFAEDNVRAAMTCIRFYCKEASSYSQMRQNCVHLRNAQRHMEDELAKGGWVDSAMSSALSSVGSRASPGGKGSVGSLRRKSSESSVLPLKMDPRDVDRHINTIRRQEEVAKFLGNCETAGKSVAAIAAKVANKSKGSRLPTLFDSMADRLQVAVLTIVCGKDVEEGFGLAYRVMQDYNLRAVAVFELAGRMLVSEGRPRDLVHLISCIQSSGISDCESVCDQVAEACIQAIVKLWEVGWEVAECAMDEGSTTAEEDQSMTSSMERSNTKSALSHLVDPLLKVIVNPHAKMSAYIACGQLKNAYLIAVKLNSNADVERIAKEAERLGQGAILRICLRRLEMVKGPSSKAA
ncbi:uncharacterized protein LOC124167693 isoform X2 [Ischnura elegans]|uniref:uncharacterized protein LOC124167693 isoform X2 n=1 Tax=Ischnura elegans TaxID=197161 RepID=UPI001ED8B951|nr:uncharacterized protein LOC124167693 isoform X2 [Ischnura elegans]